MFTGEKTAQMAAYFIDKEDERQIEILKLIKLLYLADRESVDRYGEPISYDKMVSMDHGPVLSRTLDLINGCVSDKDGAQWDAWISDRKSHCVSLRKSAAREHLDQLSDADIEVLADVWDQFGQMSKWEIRDYTYDRLSEWRDPRGSSLPISEYRLLVALGRGEQEAREIAEEIREQRQLNYAVSTI